MITVDRQHVRLNATPASKEEAIRQVGQVLVAAGNIAPGYVESMLARESVANTYLGNGIAIPHGQPEQRHLIHTTGIAVLQVPQGVPWNGNERATLVVGIAARSDEHIAVLRRLTRVLGDAALVTTLATTNDAAEIIAALTGERPADPSPAISDYAQYFDATIPNPTGLHARPATAFVDIAREYRAAVRVRRGSDVADGKSLMALLQLGAEHGAQVRVSAEGPDAEAALRALQQGMLSGLGEGEDHAEVRPVADHGWVPQHAGTVITGISAADGLAIGVIRQHARAELTIQDTSEGTEREGDRLQAALNTAQDELEQVYAEVKGRLGASKAAIFRAHAEFVQDAELVQETVSGIFDGQSAARAWNDAIARRVTQMQRLDDPVLAGRAVDLSDVGQRVLRHILGVADGGTGATDAQVVLVADDLTPSDTAALDPDAILGFCTAVGGPTSHSAIIARSMGIPAVVAAGRSVLRLADGTPCVIDGTSGRLYLHVSDADVQTARDAIARLNEQRDIAAVSRHEPAVTTDGRTIEVVANVNRVPDAIKAVEAGAEGVGLMRTEFLYLERASIPTEDDQYEVYRAMVESLQGRPLIIRTLDIGGDKEVPYLNLPKEDNSFLGIRGIRLCLARPDLFVPQLRAIYRAAAHGPIKMMFPMIATMQDWTEAKGMAEHIRLELNAPQIDIGIMVEVPSAAILADAFAEEVAFFSVGTNDLTQYTLAMDRLHPQLARQADALHPAVLQMIDRTVQAANRHGKWVGVCGGIAGDPRGAAILVGLGVHELSVGVPGIAPIKRAIRERSMEELQSLAQRALACRSAAEVRAL